MGNPLGNCYNKIEIARPPITVWQTIHDFHDMSWAPEVVTSLEKVGDKSGTEIGAKRILNGKFHETLQTFDPQALTFSYSIDVGSGQADESHIKHNTFSVELSSTGNGTLVEWSSTSKTEDDDANDGCDPIYAALLTALRDSLTQTG